MGKKYNIFSQADVNSLMQFFLLSKNFNVFEREIEHQITKKKVKSERRNFKLTASLKLL